MSTQIRPELSGKNKYWIEKHRFYELRHFCLQYRSWLEQYKELDGYPTQSYSRDDCRSTDPADPTERIAERKLYLRERMDLVRNAAKATDEVIGHYIFKAVTQGKSYEHLRAKDNIPCCKNTYYDLYRKFFWLLDHARK